MEDILGLTRQIQLTKLGLGWKHNHLPAFGNRLYSTLSLNWSALALSEVSLMTIVQRKGYGSRCRQAPAWRPSSSKWLSRLGPCPRNPRRKPRRMTRRHPPLRWTLRSVWAPSFKYFNLSKLSKKLHYSPPQSAAFRIWNRFFDQCSVLSSSSRDLPRSSTEIISVCSLTRCSNQISKFT